MSNTCVIGLQWGDEGKGKIIDILADAYDIIVRYQGGSNAGHTVVLDRTKFIFHLLPSGILHHNKQCVIANGVALDPAQLLVELEEFKKHNIPIEDKLFVSDRAHVVFPYHKLLDLESESGKRDEKIGTTGRGIGPCYADKMSRTGMRIVDLYHPKHFKNRLKEIVAEKNVILQTFYEAGPLSWKEIYKEYVKYAEELKPYICDTVVFLNAAIKQSKRILFEGAQGTMLDVDFGTYPYVTSSNPSVCGVSSGTGISPRYINDIYGVMKAYTTRVGSGPFPTEAEKELSEALRERGTEYGATTGRPRRCGWFDAVAVRYAVTINAADSTVLTKLDVLDSLESIKVCVAYKINKHTYDTFPSDLTLLPDCKPVYEEIPGWLEDTSKITEADKLPERAREYIRFLEKIVGLRIRMVSVGPERKQIIRISHD
ncbi:MAG: adenylosuccinate synthase [Candidatus Brocadiales bacterium]|nr:adenylosuccinate synthase [Candidatus Bathyanammoxibius amoris]